jgi:glycosyltransferase involved in cell wall biosynthesis
MKAKPYISVIIPAYNEEKYISLCLDRLTHQSLTLPYEIIVINNNSIDTTAKICKKYKIITINEKRKGYVYAVMKGVLHAKAPIIVLTDADTRVPSYWLERIYDTYKKNPDVVAVGGGFEYFDGPLIVRLYLKICNRIHPRLLLSSLSGMNMSFRKDVYGKIGGYSDKINLQADTYLGNKLLKAGKVIILKNNTVMSSARRLKTFFQILSELFMRIINAVHLKLFNTTFHKNQIDYR